MGQNSYDFETNVPETTGLLSGEEGEKGESLAVATELKKLRSTVRKLKLELNALRETTSSRSFFAGTNNDVKVLPQDTFSFLVVSVVQSATFCVGIFVCVFQMATFLLVCLDLLSKGDGAKNPFGIPGDVSAELRATQCIAILVAVCLDAT